MLRLICLCLLIEVFASKSFEAIGQSTQQDVLFNITSGWQIILGEATNNLQPSASIAKNETGWSIELELNAQTNFTKNTWLKITNYIGSKLELWQTNGVQIISTNADVLGAFHLAKQTTVSEIMESVHPRNRRGLQWWHAPLNPRAKMESLTTIWSLQSAFDISPTNDYVLQITPLIYKVETNEVTAHLIEFPPIKIKLMANGNVQKLK